MRLLEINKFINRHNVCGHWTIPSGSMWVHLLQSLVNAHTRVEQGRLARPSQCFLPPQSKQNVWKNRYRKRCASEIQSRQMDMTRIIFWTAKFVSGFWCWHRGLGSEEAVPEGFICFWRGKDRIDGKKNARSQTAQTQARGNTDISPRRSYSDEKMLFQERKGNATKNVEKVCSLFILCFEIWLWF